MNEKAVVELLAWKDALPPVLQVDLDDQDTTYLPHILILQ